MNGIFNYLNKKRRRENKNDNKAVNFALNIYTDITRKQKQRRTKVNERIQNRNKKMTNIDEIYENEEKPQFLLFF